MIYLDWASTSPPDSEILQEAATLAASSFGNPSSPHELGRAAKAKLEEARARLGAALGLPLGPGAGTAKGRIVFTGSGSEADTIPLLSLLKRAKGKALGSVPHLIVSEIEHSAVYEQSRLLESLGLPVSFVKPGPRGILAPEAFAEAMRDETALVLAMAVNNETGAIQPLVQISRAIKAEAERRGRRPPRFHADSVQALGKIELCPPKLGLDSAAFSAHKLRGMRGSGALWLAGELDALVVGGGQEGGTRPGTESLQAAWAFSRAAEKAIARLPEHRKHARALEALLIPGLEALGALPLPLGRKPGDEAFSPFILSAAFPGLSGEVLVRALSDGQGGSTPRSSEGIAVSTGSACNSNSRKKGRRVLEAMGLEPALAFSAIRISTGELTTEAEIETFLEVLSSLYSRLKI